MRWASAGVMVLLMGVVVSGQETTAGWTKFSSDDANVAILFPGKPQVNDTKGGKEVLFETKNGKVAYMLRFDPFPANIDPTDTDLVDRVFDGVKSGLKKSGGTIKKEKNFKVNKKYPGLEIDATSGPIPDHKIKVIITEKWLIQVHAGGTKGTPTTEDSLLFLNSFLLKE
jgi:hypothetical protein